MASKTVCTMTADIPGEPSTGFYGETVTISFEGGYLLEEKADEKHLIDAAKAFALELYGENVYVNLFDEQGNEIWMR